MADLRNSINSGSMRRILLPQLCGILRRKRTTTRPIGMMTTK